MEIVWVCGRVNDTHICRSCRTLLRRDRQYSRQYSQQISKSRVCRCGLLYASISLSKQYLIQRQCSIWSRSRITRKTPYDTPTQPYSDGSLPSLHVFQKQLFDLFVVNRFYHAISLAGIDLLAGLLDGLQDGLVVKRWLSNDGCSLWIERDLIWLDSCGCDTLVMIPKSATSRDPSSVI